MRASGGSLRDSFASLHAGVGSASSPGLGDGGVRGCSSGGFGGSGVAAPGGDGGCAVAADEPPPPAEAGAQAPALEAPQGGADVEAPQSGTRGRELTRGGDRTCGATLRGPGVPARLRGGELRPEAADGMQAFGGMSSPFADEDDETVV